MNSTHFDVEEYPVNSRHFDVEVPRGQGLEAADLAKRYPKAQSRDYDGNPARITEADAVIAYLQVLGTLVDFKLYNDKANIR